MHALLPKPSALAGHWSISPDVVYLNHGSYGACPTAVLDAQTAIRARMERELVEFFMIDMERMLDDARARIGGFLGCRAQDLAPTRNATQAIAAVIAHLDLGPGDEILINDHEYSSCLNEFARSGAQHGFKVVTAGVPFPSSTDRIADALLARVTPSTKAALISVITSPTAMIFPIDRVVAELRERGIVTIIDGAHAAGQIPVNIESIGCDFYAGVFHKWACAPKGTGYLWVHPDRQDGFEPLALSSRAHIHRDDRARFNYLFDYVGTDDYTGWLTVPGAIDIMASLVPGGWDEIRTRNHDLVIAGRKIICERLGVEPPLEDSLVPSMATIILPGAGAESGGIKPGGYEDPMQQTLVEKWRIQVPVWSLPSTRQRLLRISAQLYNSIEQYEYLAEALAEELAQPI